MGPKLVKENKKSSKKPGCLQRKNWQPLKEGVD
jgi:hypothetical protein